MSERTIKTARVKKINEANRGSLAEVLEKQILIKNDKYRMICFVFEAGKGLPNHTHQGLAAIQVISGEVEMSFVNGQVHQLKVGDVFGFDASIEHNVIAKKQSKVLVTIIN
ncbi:cupin domain-containing protein [Niameybacter massiliensis]|uniref:cupin domain-containing protein n=1 Tax=Niameybacter massiliensis TaxID=1658108 RepID=UPI0009E5F18B|nr:cupin domain-containing protein [Niameybacter massiliensis]